MTKAFYDHPPVQDDRRFYPLYPDFNDLNQFSDFNEFSSAGNSDAAAAAAAAAGQLPPGFPSTMCQAEGDYPYGWGHGLVEVDLPFVQSPGIVGAEGHGLHRQASWAYGEQTNGSMVGSGTMTMASPMSQYPPMGESMPEMGGGCYDPLRWPPPPIGQISPSPSQSSYQSSYYASSPASCGGPRFSRHNSVSSLPASRASAVEPTWFDARLQPVRDQTLSPDEAQFTPGGIVPKHRPNATTTSSSASQKTEPRRRTRTKAATSHNTGALSPPATPSSNSGPAVAAPNKPEPGGARGPPTDRQTPKASRTIKPAPPQEAQRAHPHAKGPLRTRNRAAATKCREKSKLAEEELESSERAMSSEHQRLSVMARGLRDEVLLLKHELLAHGNCDDASIQQYLSRQARMFGNGLAQQQLEQEQEQQVRGYG
ncbi:hypothetical protein SLS64_011597 [Diaporthe eres]|uniref:BZIP domain-containing protein n=1 Tax=Diaporthe eres TaxID=83184 RepID=A0ABR1P5X2_DIAER